MTNRRTAPVHIILADDHAIVRRGLAALLELEQEYKVVAEASNGEEVLQWVQENRADLTILDLSMPRLNGLETIRRLHRERPDLKLLVLSMYDDAEFVAQALHDGASGYILKQSMEDELFEALEAILTGQTYISPLIDQSRLQPEHAAPVSALTPREREILQLVAEGHTTPEIAELLVISPHTVNRHRANIMLKLDARNQMELVRIAVERRLIILQQPPA